MNEAKIISSIPITKVLKLVLDLIKYAKGGITKEEGKILLEDLAFIAADLGRSLSKG